MKKNIFYFTVFALLFPVTVLHSQTENNQENNSSFKIGVFYNSSLNYYGRADSLRSSGIFPLAEIWFNKSLYLSGAPVFINNAISNMQYAGSVITLGYIIKSKNEKVLSHAYLLKPIYKENNGLVQSALKAQAGCNFSLLNEFINLNFGGDIKLSDKIDYGLTGGMDHLFRKELPDNFSLVVNPSVSINAGTQQFTKTFYKQNNYLNFPVVTQQVSKEVSKLNILSYEFSMPVILAKNKLQFILNPAYVIPQNLITVENRPDLSERGKNMFYITVGTKIIF